MLFPTVIVENMAAIEKEVLSAYVAGLLRPFPMALVGI